VEFVASVLPDESPEILEPSVGDGAFLSALADKLPQASLTALDIDEHVIEQLQAREEVGFLKSDYFIGDFINYAAKWILGRKRFGLIIGNPPFIRKHNFSEEFKSALDELATAINYPRADLKNSWVAFLLASTVLLRDHGMVAFILPYEIMTVVYGQSALRYLLKIYERIDLFVSDEKAFPEIDQDAIIFVARKRSDAPRGLFVQRVKSMDSLGNHAEVKIDITLEENLALELSSFLISSDALSSARRLRSELPTIGDYCTSAPGVVTAANEYFIITEAKAIELGLMDHTLPVLKKGSLSTRQPIFRTKDFDAISEREPCRLVRITGPIEALPPELKRYVEVGEQAGYHLRYKCRNREHWYEVPLVEKRASFIFKRSHEFPRLCLNEAGVHITDTAYGLNVREGYSDRGICFSFYNSLTLLFAETDGRFYGGGVLELSPKEFRRLPLVYHEPSEDEFKEFLAVHEEAQGNIVDILDFGDQWLAKKVGLSQNELDVLRSAWNSVRAHRLRHGRHARIGSANSTYLGASVPVAMDA